MTQRISEPRQRIARRTAAFALLYLPHACSCAPADNSRGRIISFSKRQENARQRRRNCFGLGPMALEWGGSDGIFAGTLLRAQRRHGRVPFRVRLGGSESRSWPLAVMASSPPKYYNAGCSVIPLLHHRTSLLYGAMSLAVQIRPARRAGLSLL